MGVTRSGPQKLSQWKYTPGSSDEAAHAAHLKAIYGLPGVFDPTNDDDEGDGGYRG